MRFATILILASSCASQQLQPVSSPSSLEVQGYELVSQGDLATADGLFLTIPNAREMLKAQRMREMELEEQLAEAQMERDRDAKALKVDAWCSRWCLPLGIGLGIIGGGAFGIWAAQRK